MHAHPASRLLVLLVLLVLGGLATASSAGAQCNTTQLCPANANPCTISAACTVNAGSTFDIRPRALVIKEGKALTIGPGVAPLTIWAGSILLEKGARIIATGTTGAMGSGGAVVLEATTTITLQSQGNTNAKIDTVGAISGGSVEITAGGNVSLNGQVLANSSSPNGFGGIIDVVSETGTVDVSGVGLQAAGGNQGENGASGGAVGIFAQGNVTITAPIDVSGGDCVCDISIESAAGNVTTTAAGDFNLRGKGGIGDGGATSLSAAGNVTMAGDVFAVASGSGGEFGFGGGFGGDLDVFAQGSIVLTGRVDLDGASPDGDGGGADLQADLDITLSGYLGAPVDGLGTAGDVVFAAGRTLSMNGTVDVSGDDFGGTVDASAVGTVTIAGLVDASTPSDGFGGTILVQACTLDTTASSRLDARGLGAFPAATNYLLASNKATTRGRLLAGSTNRIDYLATPPSVIPPAGSPPLISPAVTTMQNPTLPCCVACAVCGDGTVSGGEQCDDGNVAGGDCCSAFCQFEAANAACASDGNACTRDVCNGAGACTHPAANAGTVCRPATGTCDVAETCTGTSTACPADVLVGAGVSCRAAAGVCDVAETCTGSSGLCPADAKSTAPCRAAAGVCDVAERCDGVGNECPANVFEPSTTVCRAAAGDCDVADTCSGSSAACGPDVKRTSICRAATGTCDVAEQCDGVSDACPGDVIAGDGTSCGGDACSGPGTCSAGVCSGGDPIACGACETCDPAHGCVATPRMACTAPVESRRAQFQVKDSPKGEASDQVIWKWVKGGATTAADFGNPTTTDGMDFCVYDRSAVTPRLLYRARVLPDRPCGAKPCWSANATKGFRYVDRLGTPEGITQITLAAGPAGKAKILVRGKGANLSNHAAGLPAPPLTLPLLVQLQSASGTCWEAAYSAAGVSRNTPLEFNGKAD